jgi:F1F0 ATPase subunit 2
VTDTLIGVVVATTGGGALSAVYFEGLRWTVRRLPASRRPARLAAASFLARALAVSVTLVALAGGDAVRLLHAVAAFLAVRQWILARARAGLRVPYGVKG